MTQTIFRGLTELIVILHMAFIIFVIAGGFVARGKRWLTIVHLTAVAWAIYVEMSAGVICPLTDLENHFASNAGLSAYKEDFITRYLVPVIYPENLTFTVQYVLAGSVVIVNLVAYRVLWWRRTAG
jgi:hypothetical protein